MRCVVCGAELTGRQRLYCSKKCSTTGYNRAHREERAEKALAYYYSHRDEIAAKRKAAYWADPEAARAKRRERRRNDPNAWLKDKKSRLRRLQRESQQG